MAALCSTRKSGRADDAVADAGLSRHHTERTYRTHSPVANPQVIVTGNALASLQDGRFQLTPSPLSTAIEINAARAEALALAWRLDFGQWLRGSLSADRGSAVEPEKLAVCRRTLYAESTVEPDLTRLVDMRSAAFVRAHGPWWLVSLCGADQDLHVILAVSAYSTDLTIENGRILAPAIGGVWFFALGVPPGVEMVVSPEEAAITAAQLSGHQVTTVPRLIAPPLTLGAPQMARWQVELDGPVRVRPQGSSNDESTQTLYVSGRLMDRGRAVHVPAKVQPDVFAATYDAAAVVGEPARPAEYREFEMRRRNAVPAAFTLVSANTPGVATGE